MERYFRVRSDSQLYNDYMSYRINSIIVNERVMKFFAEFGVESTKYIPGQDCLGIIPTDSDRLKFSTQLRKDEVSNGVCFFKKKSPVGKAWAILTAELKPKCKPSPIFYVDGLIGRCRTRLFEIDKSVYCSIDSEVEFIKPDFLEELRASEFFKVVEDYEDRRCNDES